MLDKALHVGHVEKASAVAQPFGLGALLIGHVDADHLAAGADLQRSNERVHTRSAAEVYDGFTGLRIGEVKIVSDAGERLDRLGGAAIEVGRRATAALGRRPAPLPIET